MALRSSIALLLFLFSSLSVSSAQTTTCADRAANGDIVNLCPFAGGSECCAGASVTNPVNQESIDCQEGIALFQGNDSTAMTDADCNALRFLIEWQLKTTCPCDYSLTDAPVSIAPVTTPPVTEDPTTEPMCSSRTIQDLCDATGICAFADTACWTDLLDFDLVAIPATGETVSCDVAYDEYLFSLQDEWTASDCDAVLTDMNENCRCQPTLPPGGDFGGGFIDLCFSGSSTMTVFANDKKKKVDMKDLQIGDLVLTSDQKYEPIYSFGHRTENTKANFIKITTATDNNNNNKNAVEMSPNHMIYTKDRGFIPASLLRKNNHIVNSLGEEVVVQSIAMVTSKGMYAPFTPSGQLVVNDIVVSAFVALDPTSPYLTTTATSLLPISVSYQWLAHTFEFPHRLICYYFGNTSTVCPNEVYNQKGISEWVAHPLAFSQWLLKDNNNHGESWFFFKTVILLLILAVLGIFTVLETIILNTSTTLLVGVVVFLPLVLLKRRKTSCAKKLV